MIPAVKRVKEIHKSFCDALFDGIPQSEIQRTEETLEQMMENLNRTVWHRMEE